jgi:hypothetical protein
MKTFRFVLAMAALTSPLYAQGSDSVITPEPGTVGLMVLGLAGMGIAAWRRNRNK